MMDEGHSATPWDDRGSTGRARRRPLVLAVLSLLAVLAIDTDGPGLGGITNDQGSSPIATTVSAVPAAAPSASSAPSACAGPLAETAAATGDDQAATALRDAAAAQDAGDLDGAGRIYRQRLAAHPEDGASWIAFGEHLRFFVHDPAAATRAFTAALALPHASAAVHAYALKGLGDIAAAGGDAERGIALLRQSLALCPAFETHRALGVLLLVERHDVPGALEQARLALDLAPRDPLSMLVFAILSERAGHTQDGQDAFARALAIAGCDADGATLDRRHPVHCCVFYNAACYLSVCGRREQALTMLSAFFAAPNHLHRTQHEIESDPDFAGLAANPAFIALMDANFGASHGGGSGCAACAACASRAP